MEEFRHLTAAEKTCTHPRRSKHDTACHISKKYTRRESSNHFYVGDEDNDCALAGRGYCDISRRHDVKVLEHFRAALVCDFGHPPQTTHMANVLDYPMHTSSQHNFSSPFPPASLSHNHEEICAPLAFRCFS